MRIEGVTVKGFEIRDLPPAVSLNLQQYYDIGNASSYSGSGSTVTDLAAGGYGTGSLINSPTYNSAGVSSYLTFSGTNYFLTPNLYTMVQGTLNLTMEVWVRTVSDNGVVVTEQGNLPVNNGWHDAQIVIVSGSLKAAVWPYTTTITGPAVTRNVWQQYVLTYNNSTTTQALYINGVSVGTSAIARQFAPGGSAGLWYGVALEDFTSLGDTSALACDWSIFRVYNRALSAAEVLQNYEATSWRYA